MGTVGGVTRTYGLHRHFTKPELKQRRKLDRMTLGRIFRYYRPYWKHWVVILTCIVITAGLAVLPPIAVGHILDRAIPDQDGFLLALLAGSMVVVAVVSGFLGVLQQSLTARAGQGIMFDLRRQLYRHLQRMSLWFYTSNRSGEIVSRINNDVGAVQSVASGTMVAIASNLATLIATSVAMFSMDWKLTLLAVTIVPAFYIPSRIVGRVRRRLSIQTQESHSAMLGFLTERLQVGGTMLTNIYGRHESDASEFTERSDRLRELNVRQAVVGRWLFMILSVFSAIGPAMIYWYGGFQVIQQSLSPGTLVAFAALLGLLYRPLVQLASVYVDIQAAVGVFDRIFDYLDRDPGVKDRSGARELRDFKGHVKVENVSFAYPLPQKPAPVDPEDPANAGDAEGDATKDDGPRSRAALLGVSFEIQPCQQVALVGPSGAGKSTMTYLLPRFYDPDGGRITYDGQDLRNLTQKSVREQVGMVTQETYLFHATIKENLLYAKPDATEEECFTACRAANIHDFIMGLPDGYETLVGERGFRLSGGEKQRLSIARALLKDPAFLILDEATSSLDATSEHLIQSALEKLLHGRTSLVIAHRLSTILKADKIVVLDHGKVVAMGRHEELMSRGGLYVDLFEKQFSGLVDGIRENRSEG